MTNETTDLHQQKVNELIHSEGTLELEKNLMGYIRPTSGSRQEGIFVDKEIVERFRLKHGDNVFGVVKPSVSGTGPKYTLERPTRVNGQAVKERSHPKFKDLDPRHPKEMIHLERQHGDRADKKRNITGRIIDLFAPIGKGQRGLLIAPPKCGKTTILKEIAESIAKNQPNIKLYILLIAERPEEVTEMKDLGHGEVRASTFDEPPGNQINVAEKLLEDAKQLVLKEQQDIVILVDSITRLARAQNNVLPEGRTGTGGLDTEALTFPRQFFGAARHFDGDGSLTIIATALVETGSKMDNIIFEELRGTSNMDFRLKRHIANRQIFPAVDLVDTGTRNDHFLLDPGVRGLVQDLRQHFPEIADERNREKFERETTMGIIRALCEHDTNEDFLKELTPSRLRSLFESEGGR